MPTPPRKGRDLTQEERLWFERLRQLLFDQPENVTLVMPAGNTVYLVDQTDCAENPAEECAVLAFVQTDWCFALFVSAQTGQYTAVVC